MVMHDRARDIIGAATIGVGPWLPVRLSGFLAVPPRLPPLQGITAAPMAATPHLAMAATPHLAMARLDATHTTVAKPGRWTLLGPCVLQVEQPPPRSGNGVGSLPLRSIIAVCCARATGGHAAADPRILMNSRRPGVEP